MYTCAQQQAADTIKTRNRRGYCRSIEEIRLEKTLTLIYCFIYLYILSGIPRLLDCFVLFYTRLCPENVSCKGIYTGRKKSLVAGGKAGRQRLIKAMMPCLCDVKNAKSIKTEMRVFVKDDRGMLSGFLVLGGGRSRGSRWVGGI
jgi:hypothetical protein